MRKMNKALAVLTVLAMLATLFVAIPASAALTVSQIQESTPACTITFTSDAAGATVIDPNAAEAGTVFYAWVDFSGIAAGASISYTQACLTWDSAVVSPAAAAGTAITKLAQYKNARVEGDITADYIFNADEYTGRYDAGQGQVLNTYYTYKVFESVNDEKEYSEDPFFAVDSTGAFRFFGYRFIKNAAGNVGVTIAAPNQTLNGKSTDVFAGQEDASCILKFVDDDFTTTGNTQIFWNVDGRGAAQGAIIANYPLDGGEEPTPTPEPEQLPSGDDVTGTAQASNSAKAPNAFFYQFETPEIPGEVTGLTATFQIDGKDAVEGNVSNIDLTGLSNVAVKIAAVVKNIPDGQEDTEVTTTYTLSYLVESVTKTLVWTRTASLSSSN